MLGGTTLFIYAPCVSCASSGLDTRTQSPLVPARPVPEVIEIPKRSFFAKAGSAVEKGFIFLLLKIKNCDCGQSGVYPEA